MTQQRLGKTRYLEFEERDQAGNVVATYIVSSGVEETKSARVDVVIPRTSQGYIKVFFNAFLPAGYPASVTKDYLRYQIFFFNGGVDWIQDSLQAFASSIAGLLSSRAVLEGVGVGDADASPTAALLLSVLQDSMGRIATILFAHRLGTSLEPECKMYRLTADIFNDSAMIFDCLSPAFPKTWRVMLLSFSSVLRALCGVAAGSSKASLSAHFATQGNLGELNAKDSSQETIISLLGMLAGALFVSHVTTQLATWTSLILLLAIHLFMNYLAVRAVSMRTLNRQRANIVFTTYLERHYTTTESGIHAILTPEEVSLHERIFESDGALRWLDGSILSYCSVGVPFSTILEDIVTSHPSTVSYIIPTSATKRAFDSLLSIFTTENYVLFYSRTRRRWIIVLKSMSDTETLLKSWMHALICARRVSAKRLPTEDLEIMIKLLQETLRDVNELWMILKEELKEAGWDLDRGAIETKSGTRMEVVGSM